MARQQPEPQEEEAGGQITAAMVMSMLDADGDGMITMEESPDELKQNFMMVDGNADGKIDVGEAEFIAMYLNSQGAASVPGAEEPAREWSEEQKSIVELVETAMTALAAQDIDSMMTVYADNFVSDQGGGVEEQRQFLLGAQEQGFLDGIEYDVSPMEITIDGDTAMAGPIDLEGAFGMLSVEFELEKQDNGEWKVTYQTQY